ncbi:SpoIID/LytB domain-containing protein [Deinococcus sp.]|uniref:SpoIID/LytB domain-containing protein n=1 Tax=Deinococcus sp. TaxID=47478 RepID=UPI0025BB6CD1|nr:SpoIID/LytB domain-containing protein [Deinococcus sp.]
MGLLRVCSKVSCSLALAAAFSSAAGLNVRVLLVSGPQVTVKVPVPVAAVTGAAALAPRSPVGADAPQAAGLNTTTWQVALASNGHLTLNGLDAGNSTLYLPPALGSTVKVAGTTYRGGLLLRSQGGSVQAINVVDVDDYVRGVVASEMPASWPKAALSAQAIIARTYVAARINPALAYDTCANASCQVYGGVEAEKPQTDAAVRASAGQVVSFRGKVASTYFSSDSGGYTASATEVWGMNNLPYLPAQPDPFSLEGPRSMWKLEIPQGQVQSVAERYGARVGALQSVGITRVSSSGRPQEITLVGTSGTFKLGGAEAGGFVRSLGAGSSRVVISGLNPLVMQGNGQGHGVGLSQYGALGLARKGYDHLHILGFYYPGTVLSVLAGVRPTGAVLADVGPLSSPETAQLMVSASSATTLLTTRKPVAQTLLTQTLLTQTLPTQTLLAQTLLNWING